MKKTIKIVITIFLLAILGVGGYYFYENYKENKRLERKMIKASSDYFEKYVSANDSSSVYTVNLFELESSGENYDLEGLENCDKKETFSKITIDYSNGKPKKTEVKLKC